MAGAKETPRNKLIALMYLVFITMLALNVSKEVLVGFGQMFHKINNAKAKVSESNEIYYSKIIFLFNNTFTNKIYIFKNQK